MTQLEELSVAIRRNEYMPHFPHPPQIAFLLTKQREVMYGGAAGGGKSDALLMAALQYVDMTGYSALLLRRTYADLVLNEALMDRAAQWLTPTDATWHGGDKSWRFPSGARLQFGYLETDQDRYRYASAEFQFIGFDELTQFTEQQYRFLFSRLRRKAGVDVPLRMRSASNPGGIGHRWVRARFMVEGDAGRIFIPARLPDNPSVDQAEYVASLRELDPVTLLQLLEGNWDITARGDLFRREKIEIVRALPADLTSWVRYWDFAATAVRVSARGRTLNDPDWTAGVKAGISRRGKVVIADVRHVRRPPAEVELLVAQTARLDGRGVKIWLEEEPGSSGKAITDHYVREVLNGYAVRGDKVTGPKEERWGPLSAQAGAGGQGEYGNVALLEGEWNAEFLDELELAGSEAGVHDDQVDAAAGAYNHLEQRSAYISVMREKFEANQLPPAKTRFGLPAPERELELSESEVDVYVRGAMNGQLRTPQIDMVKVTVRGLERYVAECEKLKDVVRGRVATAELARIRALPSAQ